MPTHVAQVPNFLMTIESAHGGTSCLLTIHSFSKACWRLRLENLSYIKNEGSFSLKYSVLHGFWLSSKCSFTGKWYGNIDNLLLNNSCFFLKSILEFIFYWLPNGVHGAMLTGEKRTPLWKHDEQRGFFKLMRAIISREEHCLSL